MQPQSFPAKLTCPQCGHVYETVTDVVDIAPEMTEEQRKKTSIMFSCTCCACFFEQVPGTDKYRLLTHKQIMNMFVMKPTESYQLCQGLLIEHARMAVVTAMQNPIQRN